jgi:hypothetical protein
MGLKLFMAKGHTRYVGSLVGSTCKKKNKRYTRLIHCNIFIRHTKFTNVAVDCMRPASGGLETHGTAKFQTVTRPSLAGQWAQLNATPDLILSPWCS